MMTQGNVFSPPCNAAEADPEKWRKVKFFKMRQITAFEEEGSHTFL
jgi:hypothetical protein